MAILARFTPKDIEVEVVDVLTTGDGRKRVLVRALAGKPFCMFTHGGPADTDSAIVSPDLLSDVHQEPPATLTGRELRHMRRQVEMGKTGEVWSNSALEAWRGAFQPYHFTNRTSGSRGGTNND